MNINDGAKKIIEILEGKGYEAYAVGGCVRDTIMGKIPNDWDITTNCMPEDMIKCFEGYRIIETGLKHGTVTVLIDGQGYEVTTYRQDGEYTDNRHPDKVTFVTDLASDLSRRDFTINAMAYNPGTGLVDLFGGREDIENKIIRCVGEPEKRFSEDALRILRALRFASVLDFSIDKATSDAIFNLKDTLENISRERINVEFTKLLCGKRGIDIIREYFDVICVFIPEMKPMKGFDQRTHWHIYDVLEHTLHALEYTNDDFIVKMTMLLHDIAKPHTFTFDERGGHFFGHQAESGKIAREILNRLRYDKNTISTVVRLICEHDNRFRPEVKAIKRVLNKLGPEDTRRLIVIQKADNLSQNPEMVKSGMQSLFESEKILEDIIKEGEAFSLAQLELTGKEVIDMGVKPGPEVGNVLQMLLDGVIDGILENEKEALAEQVLKYLKKQV